MTRRMTHRLKDTDRTTKINVLRHVFATPGFHVLKDLSAELDFLAAEASDVVAIHHRNATIIRQSPLVLIVEVGRPVAVLNQTPEEVPSNNPDLGQRAEVDAVADALAAALGVDPEAIATEPGTGHVALTVQQAAALLTLLKGTGR